MAGSQSSGDDVIAQINVTPLVDVMLVLLVIFMVTAPMLQQGVEVDLPKAQAGALSGSDEQLVISIDKEGTVFLGAGNKIADAEMVAKMRAVLETRKASDRKVYVKADQALEYGRIMSVMGKLHEAGFDQIGLVSALPN